MGERGQDDSNQIPPPIANTDTWEPDTEVTQEVALEAWNRTIGSYGTMTRRDRDIVILLASAFGLVATSVSLAAVAQEQANENKKAVNILSLTILGLAVVILIMAFV